MQHAGSHPRQRFPAANFLRRHDRNSLHEAQTGTAEGAPPLVRAPVTEMRDAPVQIPQVGLARRAAEYRTAQARVESRARHGGDQSSAGLEYARHFPEHGFEAGDVLHHGDRDDVIERLVRLRNLFRAGRVHALVQIEAACEFGLHAIDIEAHEAKPADFFGQHASQAAVPTTEIQPESTGDRNVRDFRNFRRAPYRGRRLEWVDLEELAKESVVHQGAAAWTSVGFTGASVLRRMRPVPVKLAPSSSAEKPICTAIAMRSIPRSVR